MRLLSRKYDPYAPGMKQLVKQQFYGLPNNKCKNFLAVVERIALIERLCTELIECAGSRPDDAFLAEMLYPSLDASCLTELDG